MEKPFFRFHHVSINVKNVEDSKRFYSFLGFSQFFTYDDENVTIEHLDNNGIILELFHYKNLSAYFYEPINLNIHSDFIGCEHFSLSVENIESAYSVLKAFVEKGSIITMGRTGIKYFFIKDPNGTRIEIVEDNRRKKY